LYFSSGTNPDVAQVQVQNKVQLATPVLPQTVQQQGSGRREGYAQFHDVFHAFPIDDSLSMIVALEQLLASMSLTRFAELVSRTIMFGSHTHARLVESEKLNCFWPHRRRGNRPRLKSNRQVPRRQLGQLLQSRVQHSTVIIRDRTHSGRTVPEFAYSFSRNPIPTAPGSRKKRGALLPWGRKIRDESAGHGHLSPAVAINMSPVCQS